MKKLNLDKSSKPEVSSNSINRESDIAVIGIGIHVGDCKDPQEFHKALTGKYDFVHEASQQRKADTEVFTDTFAAPFIPLGYLEGYDLFDNVFFRIPPGKASLMNPEDKLMLECAVRAAEDAGYGGDALSGSDTAVFLGGDTNLSAYERSLEDSSDSNTTLELLTPSMCAARISNFMNLKGGATITDTACSSSLTALYNACCAIAGGECETAFAGAAKFVFTPVRRTGITEIESADGKTRTFDKNSDGTGGGEACVAVLLKSLDKAIKDNDTVYAVVKSAAVSHNGASANITAPNAEAEANLIVSAWKKGRINPEKIAFIEAHGTGTKLGDVVEIEGLTQAFRRYTDKKALCTVGSLKSNTGHTDNAAGILSFVKAVLALYNREYPPTLHFTEPNPEIDFENSPVYPSADSVKLPDGIIYAGVSSFGLSGTNAHVLLESAPGNKSGKKPEPPYLFTLSAKSEYSLKSALKKWAKAELSLFHPADISFTSLTGRGHYAHRTAVVFSTVEELSETLNALCRGENSEQTYFGFHKIIRDSRKKESGIPPEETDRLCKEFEAAFDDNELNRAAKLYCKGARVPVKSIYAGLRLQRLHLPVYQFEPVRHWFSTKKSGKFSLLGKNAIKTDRFRASSVSIRSSDSWLFNEHKVSGKNIIPASAVIDTAYEAAAELFGDVPILIKDLTLSRFISIPVQGKTDIAIFAVSQGQSFRFTLQQKIGERWISASEWYAEPLADTPDEKEKIEISEAFPEQYYSQDDFVGKLNGVEVSSKWNCINYAGKGENTCSCTLSVPEKDRALAEEYFCYPPITDAAINFNKELQNCIPYSFSEIKLFRPFPAECVSVSEITSLDEKYLYSDITITDTNGITVASIKKYAAAITAGLSEYYHITRWKDVGEFIPSDRNAFVFYEKDVDIADTSKRLKDFLSSDISHIAYVLKDAKEPEKSLKLLYNFLTMLSTDSDKQIELLICGGSGSELLHASAAAMGRALEFERPKTRFRFISANSEPAGLFSLFSLNGFRMRINKGRAERMEFTEGTVESALSLRDGGKYIITGGLGGIGLFIAEYIAERIKGEIVLVSRTEFAPEKEWQYLYELGGKSAAVIGRIRNMRDNGCKISLVSADVSLQYDVQRLKKITGTANAVFHAAGVATDKFYSSKDEISFMKTLAPKIRGSVNITRMYDDAEYIVLMSSLSGITSAPGQAGYSAANAFMDSLAEQSCTKIYSLGWAQWSETGMAVSEKTLKDDIFKSIRNIEAKAIFDNMPQTGYTAVGISAEPNRPLTEDASALRAEYFKTISEKKEMDIELTGADSFTDTQKAVGAVWAEKLGYDSIDIFDDFEDLGGDSITFLGIHEEIQNHFGLNFPFGELFERTTVADMAGYIDKRAFAADKSNSGDENLLILSENGSRKIFCFPPGTAYGYTYYDMAKRLNRFSFYAFNYRESDNPPAMFADMTESVQPEGALILLGYSVGGNLAYETAKVLEKRGRKVEALIFIDNFRRLELFNFTDLQYSKSAEEYLSILENKYAKPADSERVLRRIEHYDRYIDSRMENEVLDAQIHLIKGEKSDSKIPFKITQDGWRDLTNRFYEYNGSGKHIDMLLLGEHFEKNVAIINNILVKFG